ncbi:MAG: Mur ligase family protein [Patescibacteria group bacterium]
MYSMTLPPSHAMSTGSAANVPKHLHIIGICGVGTGALAVAFKRAGWKVTGSDKGFYPPVSTTLTEAGISYHAGWHPEKVGMPDIVVAGGAGTSLQNPEVMYVKEKGIPLLSFAEAIGQFLVKKNSIVCVGTWGKTTSSALLAFIMERAGMAPSFFSGGVAVGRDAGQITESDWSVVEGDEYQAAIWDKKAKFFYYKPTHLLLTAISWDHADLYPTEADYLKAFEKLLDQVPSSLREKRVVACADSPFVKILLANKHVQHVSYGKDSSTDYRYENVSHTKAGLSFDIIHAPDAKKYAIVSPMLGAYNAENITGCFAMAREIGIAPEVAISAIKEFAGLKRRLEKRGESARGTAIDTHAPTADKAKAGLESVREVYKGKIVAIFEPNIGGRQRASQAMYAGAFAAADLVLIPRLTKLKIDATLTAETQPLEGDELAKILGKDTQVRYIEDDEKLVNEAVQEMTSKEDVVIFLGSHGFRGMIEAVVEKLKTN